MIGRKSTLATTGLAAAMLLLSGCATGGGKSQAEIRRAAAGEAERAHHEMRRGELQAALRLLNATNYTSNDDLGRARTVMKAEVVLGLGNPDEALGLIASLGANAEGDPRAAEVKGKALMASGEFGEAQGLFAKARGLYALDDDRRRVHDMAVIADGLGHYARGDKPRAAETFTSIINRDLRAKILGEMDSLSKADITLIALSGS